MRPAALPRRLAGGRWRWLPDAVGVAIVVLCALFYLSPSLKDGFSFGPTDLVSGASYLTRALFSGPVHNHLSGDVMDQSVPWNAIDWRIVHAGSLPLWNDTAGTGLPQLFNFESAAFALPTLLGYLFPLSASFLVTVLGKLLIAGIGTYVCCRVLGARAAGATLGGVSFMLSGSFSGWLGWSISGPVAWSGFILAGIVLAYRSRRRARDLWLLAVSVAFSIYGGFPEMYVIMGEAFLGLCAVTAVLVLAVNRRLEVRGILRVVVGSVAGLFLSAPLWLPGASIVTHSARTSKHLDGGLLPQLLSLTFAQGYYGLPIKGSIWFTHLSNYYESAAYLGVIAVVCAGVAILVCWRRPVVVAVALAGLGTLVLCYDVVFGIGEKVTTALGLGAVAVHRGLPFLGFCAAVLAGLGADIVVHRFSEAKVRLAFAVMVAAVSAVVAVLWVGADKSVLTPTEQALRRASLYWPTATMAMLILAVVVLEVGSRRRPELRRLLSRLFAAGLVSAQGAFLVFAGVGINSYFPAPFPSTPQVRTVSRLVGTGMLAADTSNTTCANPPPDRVGKPCGLRLWEGLGFIPNVQGGYDLDELAMHDPTIPQSYFDSWPIPDSGQSFSGNVGVFSPAVTSAPLARRYGVTDVLIPPGVAVPKGMRSVAAITIPGAANPAILAKVERSRRATFLGVADSVRAVSHPGDDAYRVAVDAPQRETLVLHLTYLPGWHVSADGHPLAVHQYERGFVAVDVPAGSHLVVARYWPRAFSEGIVAALVGIVALAVYPLVWRWRLIAAVFGHRRRRHHPDGERADDRLPS